MRVGGKPAWPLVTSLRRHLRGCSLLQFCDFKCTNYNYREDTTTLSHGDLHMTEEKPKLKLNYTCLKKGDGTMLFLHSASVISHDSLDTPGNGFRSLSYLVGVIAWLKPTQNLQL